MTKHPEISSLLQYFHSVTLCFSKYVDINGPASSPDGIRIHLAVYFRTAEIFVRVAMILVGLMPEGYSWVWGMPWTYFEGF